MNVGFKPIKIRIIELYRGAGLFVRGFSPKNYDIPELKVKPLTFSKMRGINHARV